MRFESHLPSDPLKNLVKEYWVYENNDATPAEQKIIPDGYSEIIIHYGDPYQINMNGDWETQSSILFSSQISKYFFLRNTGKSGMIGIKLHPSAFYTLFQLDISATIDKVHSLDNLLTINLSALREAQNHHSDPAEKIMLAEKWLKERLVEVKPNEKIDNSIATIFEKKGMVDVDELAENVQLSTRQLERTFKKAIGLTPKFYCRIIRFNYIFEVMKNQKDSWIRTALQSGYFDQSHFIKNFKEFTGEEPSNYGFDEKNLANFFLQK
ncbi:DUF6597 domain-containing transcriptional factor [Ekhidna sp.]|uniref:DUF6597 domain-containing transcriptional factor n=1 Tax=Ekhidna sp. TaxID=2608089 RepID=UPI003C7DA3C6